MENKIVLTNWPREIDMYYRLIKAIPSKKIEIIVNDIKSIEKGRQDSIRLLKHFNKKNQIFIFLSL